jgi:hypothetical protein
MTLHKLELLREGTDAEGHTFSREALEGIQRRFQAPLPVQMEFDETKPAVGEVRALVLVDGALIADAELDADGDRAVGGGAELAIGCRVETDTPGFAQGKVEHATMYAAALTWKKVK